MTTVDQHILLIRSAIPAIKSGSLSIDGEVFGGRVDNLHVITGADRGGERGELKVEVDQGEVLRIWHRESVVADTDVFRVAEASRVRWEWTNYGQPNAPENLLFIEGEVRKTIVEIRSNAPWEQKLRAIPKPEKPAIEILWF